MESQGDAGQKLSKQALLIAGSFAMRVFVNFWSKD